LKSFIIHQRVNLSVDMPNLLWMHSHTQFLRDVSCLKHFDLMLYGLMPGAPFIHIDARDQGFAGNRLQRVTKDTFCGHWQWIYSGLVE
jgi:hypothetical protein